VITTRDEKGVRPRRLADVESAAFMRRHIGPDDAERAAMAQAVGYETPRALLEAAIPESVRTTRPLDLPPPATEREMLAELREVASRNRQLTSLIGMGYYGTITPPVIQRNVLENPAWYTAYTPYQPEISQGRLEALLNFQTMVADLTGMDVANASLLDEATAAAEAMTMCHRISRTDANAFVVDASCHPQTIDVVRTRAAALGIDVVVGDAAGEVARVDAFSVLAQYPGTDGEVRDLRALAERAHERDALLVVATDLLALTLLTPPGELGADIAVGSSQRFGVPLWFGGPHAGFIATRTANQRHLPGRLVGVSVDAEGRPALRLALQTREQHIRRERATSNICTAQALLAIVAGLYAAYHGPDGLRAIAERAHRLATVFAEGLRRGGEQVLTTAFFDTVTIAPTAGAGAVLDAARGHGINLRSNADGTVGVSFDELSTPAQVERLWDVFGVTGARVADLDAAVDSPLPPELLRTSPYLEHPVFHRYHSETEMMRYLRDLADKDLALDRTMIPLGSCTMKLNAAAEMMPISWPAFTCLHPFVPLDQANGYRALVADLERWMAEISGYDAVSLQPNAGSQGEYAGLLAIRHYHRSRGEHRRTVCLIPVSAHGTNAASAAMAGMKVVAVACDAKGNVDLDALRARAAEHADTLAAIMLTWPSTHGVYEESVVEVARIVHEHGGQVYIDGANLNALVGMSRFAELGGDVSHFNLHKTFCIPHGGGGPGGGPIGVRAHLARFLPGSRVQPEARPDSVVGAVSAAPFGSPGVLPIAWAYLRMMGAPGLAEATSAAVLAANYVAHRLRDHYPVLYTGHAGLVAHECIIDIRPLAARTGITAEDIAKRLVDYGFHAPTMSFPEPGTLMVEPTESESLRELDRFCDAMIAIRGEIEDVARGTVRAEDSVVRRAPHTVAAVTADEWDHPYTRTQAAWPVPSLRQAKYWSPVARIDNAYGDRHLVCSCPPLEELAEA
jgi:glycine dehydrogenase